MIVAAPRISDDIRATMESDSRDKQVLHHQLVNGAPSNRIHTHVGLLVVREVAVRVVLFLRLTMQYGLFPPCVVSIAVSIGHRLSLIHISEPTRPY